jgi:hypothetical protein
MKPMKSGIKMLFLVAGTFLLAGIGPLAPRASALMIYTYSFQRGKSPLDGLVQVEPVAALPPSSGAIHIELPGEVRISLEGTVDPTMVRAVLKSLRS